MISIIRWLFEGLEELFIAIIGGTFDLVGNLISNERKTEYSAEFGVISEQLLRDGDGFRIGFKWGNTAHEANSHLICFGGSGSRKSTCICFNTLLQSHSTSYIVHDCNRELFNGTGAYLSSIGYKVYVLDYDDYTKSIGFNALHKCKSETDISRTAQVIVKNALEGAAADYWSQSAENMIAFFAFALWKYAPKEYSNFANVLNMLEVFSFDAERLDRWVVNTADESLVNRYKAIVAVPEKTRLSTLATATNALAVYRASRIAAITSTDSIDFDVFRKEKSVLYLCSSPAMSTYARNVSACFFDSFFAHLLSRLPGKGDLGITFLIDEAGSMRLTNSLPKVLELGRKFRLSVATLWQDYGQVEHIFGKNEASNILANSRLKVYMPSGQPLATCRMLQDLLGKYQYETENGGTKVRELLTAQEIFQLRQLLVLNGNNKPLLIDPAPYFENPKLRMLAEMPVLDVTGNWKLSEPQLLTFI